MSNSSSITPPWLAKLNSLNETVEKGISPVQSSSPIQMQPGQVEIQIEFKTGINSATESSILVNPSPVNPNVVSLTVTEDGAISVPADLPPGQYDAVIATSVKETAQGNLSQFNFNATAFQQSIGRGVRIEVEPVVLPMRLEDGMDQDNVKQVDPDYVVPEDKIALNYGGTHGSAELDEGAAKLDAMYVDGTSGPTLEDVGLEQEIPSMPGTFKPVAEVDLPVVDDRPAVVEYVSPDNNQPAVSEEEYYAAIVQQLAQSNPTEAQLIARLRLFQSQYVGLITSPEQAIDHISKCRFHGVPIGGSEAVELSAQSTSLKHKEYIARRYAPHKLKKEVVDSARRDWKKAIGDREAAMEQWNLFVKWHHDNYNRLKSMDALLFVEEVKQDDTSAT